MVESMNKKIIIQTHYFQEFMTLTLHKPPLHFLSFAIYVLYLLKYKLTILFFQIHHLKNGWSTYNPAPVKNGRYTYFP